MIRWLNLILFISLSLEFAVCTKLPTSGEYCKIASSEKECLYIDFKGMNIWFDSNPIILKKKDDTSFYYTNNNKTYRMELITPNKLSISSIGSISKEIYKLGL